MKHQLKFSISPSKRTSILDEALGNFRGVGPDEPEVDFLSSAAAREHFIVSLWLTLVKFTGSKEKFMNCVFSNHSEM